MIEFKNISKTISDSFGNNKNIFKNISFRIEPAKITSVIAPLGSGKSTLLKIISGLEKESSGEISGKGDRKIILIPSAPSSFPWLSVKENISFAAKDNVDVKELIEFVGLEGYSDYYPDNRSIGFRFRISLARALAQDPVAICIDEPFTRMDDITKMEVYGLIRKVPSFKKISVLIATTNITEALYLSDYLYLMGKEPAEIFRHIAVSLPVEREFSILNSTGFISQRNEIERLFKDLDSQKILHISI